MKTHLRSLIISTCLMLVFCTISVAQDPPPPPGDHGSAGNQTPSGAPIDGGLGILLAIGAGYGGYKLYRARKQQETNEEDNTEEIGA